MGILDAIRIADGKAQAYDDLCENVEATFEALGLTPFWDDGCPLDAEMLDALVSGEGLRRDLIKAGWTPPKADAAREGE